MRLKLKKYQRIMDQIKKKKKTFMHVTHMPTYKEAHCIEEACASFSEF